MVLITALLFLLWWGPFPLCPSAVPNCVPTFPRHLASTPELLLPIPPSAPCVCLYLPFSCCFLTDCLLCLLAIVVQLSCLKFAVPSSFFFDPSKFFELLPACTISCFCLLLTTYLFPTCILPIDNVNPACILLLESACGSPSRIVKGKKHTHLYVEYYILAGGNEIKHIWFPILLSCSLD